MSLRMHTHTTASQNYTLCVCGDECAGMGSLVFGALCAYVEWPPSDAHVMNSHSAQDFAN